MGPDPENIEERVSALESQVGDLNRRVRASEHDAAAARVLAGAADRDVADLGGELRALRAEFRDFREESRGELRDFRRATTASFNALREDFNDLRTDVYDRFSRVDNGFAEMRAKLDATAAGQQQIVRLIEGLISQRGENGPAPT